MPFSSGGVIIKERGDSSDTRVIVKLGYSTNRWKKISDNIIHNEDENIFVFSFPSDSKKYTYNYALLETSGTNTDDNVKYCYSSNIGNAIVASTDNCYRVSKNKSYTIKIMNPAIMYKDYELDDNLIYYVTLTPLYITDEFTIKATLYGYNTENRNFEGVGNVITLGDSFTSTILAYPKEGDETVFYQITNCNRLKLNYGIYDALTEEQIVSNTDIDDNQENYFNKFNNTFSEAELRITGTSGNKIFIKHKGVKENYKPDIKSSFPLSFDESNNQIIFTKPINGDDERLTYTVYISKEGEISNKNLTLCSFFDKTDLTGFYNRTFNTTKDGYTLSINFNKLELKEGDKFEAIAYIEQNLYSQMSFVTDILQGTVGEIKEETITKVEKVLEEDNDFVYYYQEKKYIETTFYYSFINPTVFDVPVGAFRIVLDNDAEPLPNTIYCAWVNEDDDAITSVDAVEEIIDVHKSYCIGGVNKNNNRIYNYIFKYTYTSDNKPRKFIIKVPYVKAGIGFHIYIRKGENTQITQSDFHEQREYGKQEQYKKSVMPYILDLPSIRGTSDDYISKILIYSKYFEMQMYYIDSSGKDTSVNNNAPIKLFTGNVMLVLTNPNLAQQKYFSKKLILLSEDIRGQKNAEAQNTFRFHTKMFKSSDQIEYFVSSEALGRNLNSPLSLEMNTCTSYNNIYYYILNYNSPEEEMNLYLDLIFGSMKRARIVTELTEEKWDDLINNKMEDITDYFTKIPERSTHIDIVQIQCNSPLLINAYYNTENYQYGLISLGDVVIKNLNPKESFTFGLDNTITSATYYSIQAYTPTKKPNIRIATSNFFYNSVNENSLKTGMFYIIPENVNIVNNGDSITRIIFKLGFSVESDWTPDSTDIQGTIYSYNNQLVYKFPAGDNKLNFTSVDILVNPLNREVENIKFCYSTSIGMPITTSKENCFRTGANIPYTLTFMNPLISTKNYKRYVDNYYITLIPVSSNDFIDLKISENIYETKDRNAEGAAKIINLDKSTKATILSISDLEENSNIVVQLSACKASIQMINYVNQNPITLDVISTGNVTPREKLHYYIINNNYFERKVEFTGAIGDQILVKHIGIASNYTINYQKYTLTFNERTNQVTIVKPIFDEEFTFYVLLGQKNAFKDYNLCTFHQNNINDLGDYVKQFNSKESNQIEHFIDFRRITKNKYSEGDEFDLIVFATQTKNSKLEFLYDLIQGKVGKIGDVFVEIEGKLEDNIVTQTFTKNSYNYLYYDFENAPTGSVASLRIYPPSGTTSITITKVICTFVEKNLTDLDMLDAINAAGLYNDNACIGQSIKNNERFDALINARSYTSDSNKKRLLIQIIYGASEENNVKNDEDPVEMKINLRTTGFDVSESDKGYNENENSVLVPYVLDLFKIRASSQSDYISKVLIYSSKRELEMYQLQSTAPTLLFSGNIMLIYTNPEVIKEKYSGATTMILLTTPLTKTDIVIIGENFRFKSYFFKSDNTMNYYLSINPEGRPLNIPIIMDMSSCDKPYYYILNYHYPEHKKRIVLHIDEVYGELNSKRIATKLNKEDWYELIDGMTDIEGNEYLISQVDDYHMDVIEASCKIPSLLHFYYVDENSEKTQSVAPGDISLINLWPGTNKDITLQIGKVNLTYIYTFNILNEVKEPKIEITFPEGDPLVANKNGYYTYNVNKFLNKININNKEIGGNILTKIYFKYGYSMEDKFTKIQNNIYYYSDNENRLFGYKFSTDDDRLNYTNISFFISTIESNVNFCYITTFGSFMVPSSQNCYQVGIADTYTLSILNPYIMYKKYYIGDEVMPYYVSFKTDNPYSNITIRPTLNKYKTTKRNFDGTPSSLDIITQESTILTPPNNNKHYLFIQMQVCDENREIEYNLLNAFNGSSLNTQGNVNYNDKIYYRSLLNTKLDTELQITTDTYTKVFVKYTSLEGQYSVNAVDINIKFFRKNNTLSFNQPIKDEEFKYTIYIDNIDQIKNKNYRLCNFVRPLKEHYSQSITSSKEYIFVEIDFESEKLKDLELFDLIILAEQIDNGKLLILSDVIQENRTEPEIITDEYSDESDKSDIPSDISSDQSDISSDIPSDQSDITSDIPSDKSDIPSDISSDQSDITSDIPSDKSDISSDIPSDASSDTDTSGGSSDTSIDSTDSDGQTPAQSNSNDYVTLVLVIAIPIIVVILTIILLLLFLKRKKKNSEEIEKLLELDENNELTVN